MGNRRTALKYVKIFGISALILGCLAVLGPRASFADDISGAPAMPAAPAPNDATKFGTAPGSDLGTSLTSSSPSSIIFDPRLVGQDYVLGPGDAFEVTVSPQNDYSIRNIIVSQDGSIDYPRVGEISVTGKTLTETKQAIIEKLSEYCIDPSVSINLIALRPQVVYVTGGVASTRILDVRAASNVAKAITLSGGAMNRNELLNVAVLRGDQVLHSDVYPILVNGDSNKANNLDLEAGDIVVVPINTSEFAISGAVAKPGVYGLNQETGSNEGPTRLSDAIAEAGNTIEGTSNVGGIRIVRHGADGKPITHMYDYGKALQGDESQNPIIQDKDSIFISHKGSHLDPLSIPSFLYFFKLLGV
jgi:protein involved in polysaccharide export with SLBB domain